MERQGSLAVTISVPKADNTRYNQRINLGELNETKQSRKLIWQHVMFCDTNYVQVSVLLSYY